MLGFENKSNIRLNIQIQNISGKSMTKSWKKGLYIKNVKRVIPKLKSENSFWVLNYPLPHIQAPEAKNTSVKRQQCNKAL